MLKFGGVNSPPPDRWTNGNMERVRIFLRSQRGKERQSRMQFRQPVWEPVTLCLYYCPEVLAIHSQTRVQGDQRKVRGQIS